MRRVMTWLLVIAVVVLWVQSRKQAKVLKELQGQRRWVVRAREEFAGYREMMEVHDGERGVMRARQEQVRELLGIEWVDEPETEPEQDNTATSGRSHSGMVGLHNEY